MKEVKEIRKEYGYNLPKAKRPARPPPPALEPIEQGGSSEESGVDSDEQNDEYSDDSADEGAAEGDKHDEDDEEECQSDDDDGDSEIDESDEDVLKQLRACTLLACSNYY